MNLNASFWSPSRLGFISLEIQTGPFGSQLGADEYIRDGIPVINPANLSSTGIVPDWDKTVSKETQIRLSRHTLQRGDLVFARRGELGRCGLVGETETGWLCGTGSLRVRPNPDFAHPRFLLAASKTTIVSEWLANQSVGSTMDNLNSSILGQLPVLLPPLPQQRAIAEFLDRKTAAIDALIEKKERLIALLAEKRAALIHQVVTKGLDPDVPMKDSGVPWIGNIPVHWVLHHLRRVVSRFIDYRGRTPEKSKSGIPLITAGAVRDGVVDHSRSPEWVTPEVHEYLVARGQPEVGDILFTSEAPLGEVGMVTDTQIACAQRIIMFKVNRSRVISEFLVNHFLAESGRGEIRSRASGSTAAGIRADRLKMSLVPTPPIHEQAEIVAHIEAETQSFSSVITSIEEQVQKLKEYRQSLITAAVTGQLDIPS